MTPKPPRFSRGMLDRWALGARQAGLHPPVISWGLDQGFACEFDWVGTRDPSPWLAAPEAIRYLREIGVEAVRGYNHALAWEAARSLSDAWGTPLEQDEKLVGVMSTAVVPERFGATYEDAQRLRDLLLFEDRIEIPVLARGGRLRVRVSAQIYNDRSDLGRLAEAVAARS